MHCAIYNQCACVCDDFVNRNYRDSSMRLFTSPSTHIHIWAFACRLTGFLFWAFSFAFSFLFGFIVFDTNADYRRI